MTDATPIVPIQHLSPYPASEAQALAAEVAKCLKLVAPAGMNAEQQTVWLHAAVDALEDIRPAEVAAISPELRRSVTRPAQIVPEIARLVAEKRSRSSRATPTEQSGQSLYGIDKEAQRRMSLARNQHEIEAAWRWERTARQDAGFAVSPIQKPLTASEMQKLPAHIRQLGLTRGLLEYRGGQLVEVELV